MLIAEDQEMNAEVLTDLLEMEEMSSEWARNGQIAVEVFSRSEENHFDDIPLANPHTSIYSALP